MFSTFSEVETEIRAGLKRGKRSRQKCRLLHAQKQMQNKRSHREWIKFILNFLKSRNAHEANTPLLCYTHSQNNFCTHLKKHLAFLTLISNGSFILIVRKKFTRNGIKSSPRHVSAACYLCFDLH